MYKQIITIFAGLLLLGAVITGCNHQHDHLIRVGTNVWPGYEPLYLAEEIGAFSHDDIKLIEYHSASEVIRAFRNRAIEAASLTLDEVLMLVQDDVPLRIILVHDVSNGADVILARPGINTMKDIVGKRVAIESGALGAYFISRALEHNALSINDINIHHMAVNLHEQAYLDNKVDVVVNFEPVRTRLMSQGATEIFTSKEIYGEIVDVLVVHEEIYKEHKRELANLVQGWFRGLEYFSANKRKAAAMMALRLNVSIDEVISSFNGLELPGKQMNVNMIGGNSPSLTLTIDRLEKILIQNNLLTSDLGELDILTAEFINNNRIK